MTSFLGAISWTFFFHNSMPHFKRDKVKVFPRSRDKSLIQRREKRSIFQICRLFFQSCKLTSMESYLVDIETGILELEQMKLE